MLLFAVTLLSIILQGVAIARAEGALLAQVKASGILRVCADPDNLPFSSKDPREPGYDVELAGEIAKELGANAEITWVPTVLGRSAIRQLMEGKCDLFMGLPHDQRFLSDNPRLTLSTPYYAMGHVLVLPAGSGIRELKELGSKPVAVEFGGLGAIFAFKQGHAQQTYHKHEEQIGRAHV